MPRLSRRDTLLEVRGLSTFVNNLGTLNNVQILSDVDFDVKKDEVFVLAGESGCGKSMTALSIKGLLPKNITDNKTCSIKLEADKLGPFRQGRNHPAASKIAYIFQNPTLHLNPLITVGNQIKETIHFNLRVSNKKASLIAQDLLEKVGLWPWRRYCNLYPHQLSGGMNQRIGIALALGIRPKLLIADEPTTALDLKTQRNILSLLAELKSKENFSLLWITHDLSLVRGFADHIAIMYAGRIIEEGQFDQVFDYPAHPYTQALIRCLPEQASLNNLAVIPGKVPEFASLPKGCKFQPRCPYRFQRCCESEPEFFNKTSNQKVKCFLVQKRS